jgi:hypothetical protein
VVVSPSCSTSILQDADQLAHVSLISLLKPPEASLVVATCAIVRREGCPRGVRFDSIPHYCNVSFVAVSSWHATSVHQEADQPAHVGDKIPISLLRQLEVF